MMQKQSTSLVSLQSVGVERNSRWLICDIDLTIDRGEIVSLIGPNGSGKTTLVNVVTGSMAPDTGKVRWGPGVRIGFVPQRMSVDPTLPITVRRLMNLTQQNSEREIDEILEQLNILNLANNSLQTLSGGEFQRALFARALLRKPNLLILDEPSQGLDIMGESKLYNQIVEIRDQLSCGILLVCHDLHLVMAKADTVVCINSHICCKGVPERIVGDDEFLKLFGRNVQSSHAFYPHQHDHRHKVDGSIKNL